jgi:preprotein translocase SecF subunit
MQFFKDAKYPWMSWKKGFLTFSIVLTVLCLLMVVVKGVNLGIDFKGGSFLLVRFKDNLDLPKIRSTFESVKEFGTVEIKQTGSKDSREVLIGIQKQEGGASALTKVTAIMENAFPGAYEILKEESVGPKIGDELKWAAIISIALSLLAQIIYIWFRFQFRFGIAAVIPLFHDVIITLGIFVAMGLEMNLAIVAAFLTLIGYSINDTIVVFDRIRENLAKDQRSTVIDIINRSVNETLGRTVITGGTTLLALAALYFLGVSIIKDFAFTMIVGIIFGTYSSVGVACSILGFWQPEELRKTTRKAATV